MYDVVIVGQSLAGSLTALMLYHKLPHLKVAMLDQHNTGLNVPDQRATALSPSSIDALKQLELWDTDLLANAAPIQEIHIGMHSKNPARMVFCANQHPLGYNVLNVDLRQSIHKKLNTIHSHHLYYGSSVQGIGIDTSHGTVTLANGKALKARLIIGADGRNSAVRMLLTHTRKFNYQQTALTATVRHARPHQNKALEFFLPQGALAFIPLSEPHTSTLVWSLKNNRFPIENIDPILSQLMAPYLGDIVCTQPPKQYPLSSYLATPRLGHRWVLVGDAANAIHPVAGQSLNLAIRDINTLVNHLQNQYELGLDIGSQSHLRDYAHMRQKDRYTLLGITHMAAHWMTTSSKPVATIFDGGMRCVNRCPPPLSLLVNGAQFGLMDGYRGAYEY